LEFFENVLRVLDAEMERPQLFGWFHLLWLAISLLSGIALCLWHRKGGDERRVRNVVFGVAVTVIILEVYKMINYSFSYENGIVFDFQWYAFPWQFCSTPMYIGFLAGIIRKGKVHEALCAYLATYAVFAGAAVMFYPGDVFVKTIGINIQTMICHGSMITVGIYLLYTGYVKIEHKTILKSLPVFAVTVGMAAVMNELANAAGILKTETFNMFFISPYCESTLPVYGAVHQAVPFPLNLIIYILGFTAAAYVILLLAMAARKIGRIAQKKAVALS
jgi:hypothetical protein